MGSMIEPGVGSLQEGRGTREVLVSHDCAVRDALCELEGVSRRSRWVRSVEDVPRALERGPAPLAVVFAPPPSEAPHLETIRMLRAHAPHLIVIVCMYLRHARAANALRVLGAEVVFRPDYLPSLHMLLSRALQRQTDAVQRATLACSMVRRRYRLSPRETELLELVTIGVSRKSLANELGVSENTAKTLIRRILLKVHEQSIDAVARAALEEALEHATEELIAKSPDAEVASSPRVGHGRR